MHIFLHMQICGGVPAYMPACRDTYIPTYRHMYVHTYIHAYTHASRQRQTDRPFHKHAYMHAYLPACLPACLPTGIQTCANSRLLKVTGTVCTLKHFPKAPGTYTVVYTLAFNWALEYHTLILFFLMEPF